MKRLLLGNKTCGSALKEIMDQRDIPIAVVCNYDTGIGSVMFYFEILVQLQGKVKKEAEI